jgi:hypothetical protein
LEDFMRKMKKMSGGEVPVVVLGPPPPSQVNARSKRKTVLFAAVAAVLFGFALPGCDAISDFLGLGGDSPNEPAPPNELATAPKIKPQSVPTDVEVSVGTPAFIELTEAEKELWGNNYVYEARIFTQTEPLAFSGFEGEVVADYLIVAGGGGAGGLRYATGQTLSLTDGSVTVGGGGAGGAVETRGTTGGNSSISDITVLGGGGRGYASSSVASEGAGLNGGSGGGSGALQGATSIQTRLKLGGNN